MNTRGDSSMRRGIPGRAIQQGRGKLPRRTGPPGRAMWLDQDVPSWQGGPILNVPRGNYQFGAGPSGSNGTNRGNNRCFGPSQSHPYASHSRPSLSPFANAHRNTPLAVSPSGFYRVTLSPYFMNQSLMMAVVSFAVLEGEIRPFRPEVRNHRFSFSVNEYDIAQRLLYHNQTLYLPDGTQLQIEVLPEDCSTDKKMKDTITSALRSVYRPDSKEADLSKFFTNQNVFNQRLKCSLIVASTLSLVTDLLFSLAPNLVALNLNDNLFTSLNELGRALGKFGCLKVLHIANNRIRHVAQLTPLMALNLTELDLRGNDLALSLPQLDYVREVRSVLPTLRILDGQDLLLAELTVVPDWKPFCYDPRHERFLTDFIYNYFKLYDEMGRMNLELAYHPEAVMSLLCHLEGLPKSRLHSYLPSDRNFFIPENKLVGNAKPLLFSGPKEIVGALKKLPDSSHYFQLFTCDLLEIGSPDAVQIVISGLFKEFGHKRDRRVTGEPLKYFHRCFIVVSKGDVSRIIHDSLLIRYPTSSQFITVAKAKEEHTLFTHFKRMSLNDGI